MEGITLVAQHGLGFRGVLRFDRLRRQIAGAAKLLWPDNAWMTPPSRPSFRQHAVQMGIEIEEEYFMPAAFRPGAIYIIG